MFRGVAILVVVWAVVLVTVELAARQVPTAANLERYISKRPLEGMGGEEREAVVREVARRTNLLSHEERELLREGGVDFLGQLTKEEKAVFVGLTMDDAFRKMMELFNSMDEGQRKRMVDRTLRDLQRSGIRLEGREWLEGVDPELYSGMIANGLETFYDGADAEMKMRVAPLIEMMNERMKWKR